MKEYDSEDPFEIVGVVLPTPPGQDPLAEMACCFVEEYARMGLDGTAIMRLFRDPFYRGPNMVYKIKGEEFVKALVEQVNNPSGQNQTGEEI